MRMSQKKTTLTDQLRQFIDTAEVSRYRLALQTGMSQAVLSRFMSGKGGMSMEKLDVLAEALDLEFTKRSKPAAKSRKGK